MLTISVSLLWMTVLHIAAVTLSQIQRPNIILILADDLGWNDVSFHGSPQIPTPNIDRLAKAGVILDNYYVGQMCTPSRSALLTGKYPIHLGTHDAIIRGRAPWGLGLEEKIMPQYLKEIGYSMHMLGKWHLGFFRKEYTPCQRGFDSHFGFWTGHIDYFDHTAMEGEDRGLDLRNCLLPVSNETGSYITDVFTQKAVDIIEQHNASQPLFLYVAHAAPHNANPYDPLQTTQKYYDRFPHITHKGRRLVASMVSALDDSVGEIYAALARAGLADNSIIVFSTDNGGAAAGFNQNYGSNWPLRGVKETVWEGAVRGVGFVHSPLLRQRGVVAGHMMHITDWLPTLLAAAGHPKPPSFIDGYNLWPSLVNGTQSPRTEVLLLIDVDEEMYGLRKDNYKVVISTRNGTLPLFDVDNWYPPEGLSEMQQPDYTVRCTQSAEDLPCNRLEGPCLFDIGVDPCERNNLASARPDVLRMMMGRLRSYNATVVPSRRQPPDQRARPRYHGYKWTPWVV